MNINNIIERARKGAIERYEHNKAYTNKDEGHQMIVFIVKTVANRKINDWGRDEDEDIYIGIDKEGWIEYSHTIEYGAGPIKIINPKVTRFSNGSIANFLKSDECTDKEYLMFMSTAYKFY